ncbi:hypothetical protein Gotur_022260, partial [Gossypium turneri]
RLRVELLRDLTPLSFGGVSLEGTPGLEDIRVGNLLQVDGMDWENDLLNGLLAPMDVECVRCVPISLLKPSDELIWHFSKPGSYDVKSGYDWEVSKWRLRRVQAPIMADQTVHGTNAVVMAVVAFVTAVPKSFAVGSLRREFSGGRHLPLGWATETSQPWPTTATRGKRREAKQAKDTSSKNQLDQDVSLSLGSLPMVCLFDSNYTFCFIEKSSIGFQTGENHDANFVIVHLLDLLTKGYIHDQTLSISTHSCNGVVCCATLIYDLIFQSIVY